MHSLPAIPETVTRWLQTAQLLPLRGWGRASGKEDMAACVTVQVRDGREREKGKLVFPPYPGLA